MTIVGEAASGSEIVSLAVSSECDVVVLDIVMPNTRAADTLRQLKQLKPSLRVVMLSGYSIREYAVDLIHAGADGYVQKEAASGDLITAIRAVSQRHKYVNAAVADLLIDQVHCKSSGPVHEILSEREFQVFCKLGVRPVGVRNSP